MTEQTDPQRARAKLWSFMETFQAAMLVTRAQNGTLAARPMSPIFKADEELIYILTETASETVRSVRADPVALLSFADGKRYISTSVRADVSENRVLIERLWNPGAQAFWPEGPANPRLCALVLRPVTGEYWEGDNAVSTVIQIVVGAVTGRQPDPGEHGQAQLS
jgi:general stress protein 26